MSERKVLNKYFPPDFDPAKVPRMRKAKDRQEVIRLMAPFSMRCNTCGEYIYAGKKFNGRKETVQGETYYGIKIFRFYLKCPVCSSEITFRTDPKNSDYAVEHGVSRNFEPWREKKEEDPDADPLAHLIEEEGLQESEEEEEDPMKALEKRTAEAKREMEIMDALQDIRTRNARIDRVDSDEVIRRHAEKGEVKVAGHAILGDQDEALVRKYFGKDLAARSLSSRRKERNYDVGDLASVAGVEGSNEHSSVTLRSTAKSGTMEQATVIAPTGISVKRARPEEPEVLSLLSEKAREQLQAATAIPSHVKAEAEGIVTPMASKRKKGTSAFGVVRKRAQ